MKRHALCIIPFFGMIIAGLVYPISLYAQAPQAISYQAIVRDAEGIVVADQQVTFKITIHTDGAAGPEVYCETHTTTSSPLGLVTLEIGNGTLVFGSFEAIDWSTGVYFLEVELDPEGGTDYVQMGTTQLFSVPYALYSEKTGQIYLAGTGIDITDEVITNTAPDQEVVISEGGGIGVTGGYPNYTLTNTAPDQQVNMYNGSGIDVTSSYPDFTITNAAPNAYHYGDAEGSDALVVSGIQGKPVSPAEPVMDQVLQWDGSQWNPATLAGASPGWSLTGNSGIDPEVNFLGTTDNLPLIFKVNNEYAGEINPFNDNTFLGRQAGNNSTGPSNIAIGRDALYSNIANSRSTAIGLRTLQWADPAIEGQETFNTAVGYEALRGIELTAITGQYNTAIGDQALCSNGSGHHNTAVGAQTLYSNTSGDHNTGMGFQALYSNTDRSELVAIGVGALHNNGQAATESIHGTCNTATGYHALYSNTTGYYNTANGYNALMSNTTGHHLVAIGPYTLSSNITGIHNVAVGISALLNNTEGSNNTACGGSALRNNESGEDNVSIGNLALRSNISGDRNTALGASAGYNSEGSDNVFLGFGAGFNETGSDKLYIANSSTNPPLIYGDFSTGNIGLGTTNPHSSAKLEVSSTDQGFLPPRMTESQRTAISSPAAGLLVFQTDAPSGYYYYTGSGWVSIEGTGAGAPSCCIDYDGNAYPTFTIGEQVWMAENLRVEHYRNGEEIPNVTSNSAWKDLTTGAYCWQGNNEIEFAKYGALYNWFAVDDSRGLCPDGWRVPTDVEWATFITHLGGVDVAGGKMKSVSALWASPNTDATNNSGFSGLPGGYRLSSSGSFGGLGSDGYFWSSSLHGPTYVWYRGLYYNHASVILDHSRKGAGFSVRCLKDE